MKIACVHFFFFFLFLRGDWPWGCWEKFQGLPPHPSGVTTFSAPLATEACMCSFNKHFLSPYNVPITDSTKDIKVNVIWSLSLESTQSSKKR